MKVERSMSCAEIGEELGISRQAVSQSLKRALIKIYNRLVSLEETEKSPWHSFKALVTFFNINNEEDISMTLRLFPKKIQGEILLDARIRNGIR